MFKNLFKNLFESTTEKCPEINVTCEINIDKPMNEELKIFELRRQATQYEQSGELDKALVCLEESSQFAKNLGFDLSLDDQLRYANYLQLAGQNDRAWSEYNRILSLFPADHDALGIIYDKMRLFLQHENKSQLAVKFGLLAYIYNASAFSQRMKANNFDLGETPRARFEHIFSDEGINECCESLLKKAKQADLLSKLIIVLGTHLNGLPKIDAKEIAAQTEELVKR